MTVIFYDEGDHDAGFVGFRVATTIGHDEDYRQEYFSLKDYSHDTAYKLAHAQDAKWRVQAEDIKRENKLKRRRKNWGKSIIVEGLRAYINTETKIRGGEKRAYFSPMFAVKNPGYGKGNFNFRTNSHGYKKAYELAVKKYSKIHNLGLQDELDLLEMIPCETLFSVYLLNKMQERGININKEEILDKLI